MATEEVVYVIPGAPRHQHRHRTSGRRRYDPSHGDKRRVAAYMLAQGVRMLDWPAVSVRIEAFYPMLKGWSARRKAGAEGMTKATRPDVDNIAKLYMDAMVGLAMPDDNIVAELTVRKAYSAKPRVVITLTKMA